ncbi:MAG: sugar phosphate nucleotidyltransferase [Chloroflexota bacterium]
MQAVILAAGKGTRLHPVTTTRSKAMAPIAGKPIIHRVMDTFWENGVRSYVLVVSPDDVELRAYFANTSLPNSTITYVEQTERLGMAHALKLAAPQIEGPFLLSACDNLVPASFVGELLAGFEDETCDAVLSLKPVPPERVPSVGIVDLDENNRVRRIVEKPTLEEAPSNIGSIPLYLFTHELLSYLPKVQPSARGEYELQDAIQMLIEDGKSVYGLFTKTRLQLTNTDDLLKLNQHYLATEKNGHIPESSRVGKRTLLHPPLHIEEGVIIGDDCSIGPNVVLEKGCIIGRGVRLQDALVLRNFQVPDGREVVGEVVV